MVLLITANIEGDRKRGRIVTRPTVQSMAALALVTALMAHLKKGGELSSADANSILERASSLLNVLSLRACFEKG